MPKEEDFIRVSGAARLAHVAQGTIRRWMDEGRLTKYKDETGRVWVDRSAVLKLVEKRPVGCGS